MDSLDCQVPALVIIGVMSGCGRCLSLAAAGSAGGLEGLKWRVQPGSLVEPAVKDIQYGRATVTPRHYWKIPPGASDGGEATYSNSSVQKCCFSAFRKDNQEIYAYFG